MQMSKLIRMLKTTRVHPLVQTIVMQPAYLTFLCVDLSSDPL